MLSIDNMISRKEALELVSKEVKNKNLVNHMIAVSAIMKKMAEHVNEDPILWELVGMLHDIDYEKTSNDFSQHGLISADMVKDLLPEEGLNAIRAHNEKTGYTPSSLLDISLYSADALSGMIVAGALVRPTRLAGMKAKSIRKRMKDKSFARAVNRENIMRCEEIGFNLNQFISLGIEAMGTVAKEIGLS